MPRISTAIIDETIKIVVPPPPTALLIKGKRDQKIQRLCLDTLRKSPEKGRDFQQMESTRKENDGAFLDSVPTDTNGCTRKEIELTRI